MEYFEIHFDDKNKDAWDLGPVQFADGVEEDIRHFVFYRQPYVWHRELIVPVDTPGAFHEFNFNVDNVIVVSPRVGEIVTRLAGDEVQRISVRTSDGRDMEILNLLAIIDCFDHERSVFKGYYDGSEEGLSHLAGKPKNLMKIVIRPEAAAGHHMFRVKLTEVGVVVSQTMLDALMEANVTGFVPIAKVSGPDAGWLLPT